MEFIFAYDPFNEKRYSETSRVRADPLLGHHRAAYVSFREIHDAESIRDRGLTFVALSTLALSAWADDEKIALEKLPAAVKNAIKKKFHKAEIEKATKEVEDGKTTYEVLLEIDDSPVDVAFSADGTILEIEKVIPADKVPARVMKCSRQSIPGPRLKRSRRSLRARMAPPFTSLRSRPRSSWMPKANL